MLPKETGGGCTTVLGTFIELNKNKTDAIADQRTVFGRHLKGGSVQGNLSGDTGHRRARNTLVRGGERARREGTRAPVLSLGLWKRVGSVHFSRCTGLRVVLASSRNSLGGLAGLR